MVLVIRRDTLRCGLQCGALRRREPSQRGLQFVVRNFQISHSTHRQRIKSLGICQYRSVTFSTYPGENFAYRAFDAFILRCVHM